MGHGGRNEALDEEMTIGVMALQGSYQCHAKVLTGLDNKILTREIREIAELDGIDGLILPGGESSAMGVLESELDTPSAGIFTHVKRLIEQGLPVYGTCAGLILLCNQALGQKSGGQPLIGGLDATVCRNFFGSQVQSFELPLKAVGFDTDFPAVFIRAPAILRLGKEATSLASVSAKPCKPAHRLVHEYIAEAQQPPSKKQKNSTEKKEQNDSVDVIVAAKQNNILVTSFHPELTNDTRWHQLFISMCKEHKTCRDI